MEVAKKFIKSMKSAKINWDDPIEVSVFQSLVSEVCQQAIKNCCEAAKIREKRRRGEINGNQMYGRRIKETHTKRASSQ